MFVKELAAVRFAYRVAAFAAAEKGDYEELSTFRQTLLIFSCFGKLRFFAPPTFPANPATLAPPALQRGVCVARERILKRRRPPDKPFLEKIAGAVSITHRKALQCSIW
ncbi:hypothetical protein [Cupriavidus basilensis]|uniref:hypothetical protein n=1 Tax=Cupriavidus basilensis TaxID=68895 RepID=UPI0023E776E1|nr:hypothetical protein [Cupriavidus basilensis]MDF3885350.1 hypothetical protein [Cupriavidus basilensis]